MLDRREEYVRDLAERNVSRREILEIGARLGLSMTVLGAILAEADLSSVEAAGTGSGWPKTNVPEPKSPVTISVAHAWEASFWPRQVAFDRAFMKRHPNIKIKAENTPWGSFLTKYLTQAAGGSLPDLLYSHFSWIQNFIKLGTVIPLDPYIAKTPDFSLGDFTKPSLYAYRKNGQLYAIPYDTGPIILYYNKDIFDKARMPYPAADWTLEHLKQAAKALTHGSGPSKVFGYGGIPGPGADLGPIYLYPFGAKFVNEPQETTCLLDQPPAVAAMEWWYDFQKRGLVPSPAQVSAMPGGDAFLFGKVAMSANGSWYTPTLNQNARFKWDVQFWPRGPKAHTTSAEGSGYVITSSSNNKDAAWIYLNEYISTAGQIFMWASTGRGSPARNSAWPAYLHSQYAPKHAAVVLESLNTFARPDVMISPVAPKAVTAATAVWQLVIAGKMAVPQALKQICSTIDPILAQNK
jgi:multiple sugar transport system substrate-binding protein